LTRTRPKISGAEGSLALRGRRLEAYVSESHDVHISSLDTMRSTRQPSRSAVYCVRARVCHRVTRHSNHVVHSIGQNSRPKKRQKSRSATRCEISVARIASGSVWNNT